jgi:hypothetical protein
MAGNPTANKFPSAPWRSGKKISPNKQYSKITHTNEWELVKSRHLNTVNTFHSHKAKAKLISFNILGKAGLKPIL